MTLPRAYLVLGAGWLLMKTEGALFDKAVRWGRAAVLPMGLALLAISIATPLVSPTIARKWFACRISSACCRFRSRRCVAFVAVV